MYKSDKVTLDWYTSLFPAVSQSASNLWCSLNSTVYNSIGNLCLIPTKSMDKLTHATSAVHIQMPTINHPFLEKFVSDHGKYKICNFPTSIATKVPNLQIFSPNVCLSLLRECVSKFLFLICFVYHCLTVLPADDVLRVPYGLPSPSGGTILQTPGDVMKILEYLLDHKRLENEFSMEGLPLLPLESDEIGIIGKSKIYIHSSSTLLPYGKELFLSELGFQYILPFINIVTLFIVDLLFRL